VCRIRALPEEYTYFLPGEELASKYIAMHITVLSLSIEYWRWLVTTTWIDIKNG
jgi:hypothetical protein